MRHSTIEILESRIAPATVFVTTLGDSGIGSLRAAITAVNAASGASTISFNPNLHGSIILKSALPGITNSVAITAPGITINGAGKFPDLSITDGAAISITGLTLKGGASTVGAGLYISDTGGAVTLTNCTITGNHVTEGAASGAGFGAAGGGVYVNASSLTIISSKITGNSATGGAGARGDKSGGQAAGGGIFNSGSALVIQASVVSGNTVRGGAGGAGINYSVSRTHVVTAASSGGEGGYAAGGGVYSSHGTLTILDSVISGNTGAGGRGGVGGKASRSAAGTYGGGGGGVYGGGILSQDGTVNILYSTVSGNVVIGGKGAAGSRGNGTTGNKGKYGYEGGAGGAGGGGISSYGDTATIVASTFSGDTAISGKASGRLAESQPHSVGGGIYLQNDTATLSLVTVARNSAGTDGGGIWISQGTTATIHNCTIAENSAGAGGGIFVSSGTVNIVSTIIGLDHAKTDADVDGTINSSFDLIQNVGADGANITSSHDITGVSPLLGPLGYHDGGATETLLPSASSPAVVGGPGDNIDSLTADQNGQPFGGSVDIGAVQTTR